MHVEMKTIIGNNRVFSWLNLLSLFLGKDRIACMLFLDSRRLRSSLPYLHTCNNNWVLRRW